LLTMLRNKYMRRNLADLVLHEIDLAFLVQSKYIVELRAIEKTPTT
jgi:hypothetical protein